MTEFAYHAPHESSEVLALLAEHGRDAVLLAGGSLVVPQWRAGTRAPAHVVSLRHISALRSVRALPEGGVELGALVTMRTLERHPAIEGGFAALQESSAALSVGVRGMATVGGNVACGGGFADSVPALVALRASATLVARDCSRSVSIEDLLTGDVEMRLSARELLTSISLPFPAAGQGCAYLKHVVPGVAGVGVGLVLDQAQRCTWARIAYASVGERTLRGAGGEASLIGRALTPSQFDEAARLAVADLAAVDDARASARYRTHIAEVLTRQVLDLAHQRALASLSVAPPPKG
jgi:carbon-monoxide dehydrogenase medium subunit